MQQKETSNSDDLTDVSRLPDCGRVLGIDPGTRRCGISVSDELRLTTRPLASLERTSWKKLLSDIKHVVAEFDASAVVIGLPLESDGTESEMSGNARDIARKLELSLDVPVFLQDERNTTYEARRRLWQKGIRLDDTRDHVDSEAAAVILADFLDRSLNAASKPR